MNIDKLYNYVYLITNIITGIKYIGSRSCDILPEDDIGKIYFSSSSDKLYRAHQKNNPEQYKYEVLSVYKTRKEAFIEEERLHILYDVANNENYLNRSHANYKFNFSAKGKLTVKDKNNNYYQVNLDDSRLKSGELVHMNTGLIAVLKEDGTSFMIRTDDPDYINGKYKTPSHGKGIYKDKNGNIHRVDTTDERVLSGEFISICIGYVMVKD